MIDQGRWQADVRTLFLSDVHLGCRFVQAERLLELLASVRPERIYLVGDFVDAWRLGCGWCWRPVCRELVERLARLAGEGTDILYVAGNHDGFLRLRDPLAQMLLKGCGVASVEDEFIHETADGRRLLVTHGDSFDATERWPRSVSRLLMHSYDAALAVNGGLSRLVGWSRSPYALCAWIKDRIKEATGFLAAYEGALIGHARRRGCDGVVCGHLHTPRLSRRDGLLYCNVGDWIENGTAVVELRGGDLELRGAYRSTIGEPLAHGTAAERRLLGCRSPS